MGGCRQARGQYSLRATEYRVPAVAPVRACSSSRVLFHQHLPRRALRREPGRAWLLPRTPSPIEPVTQDHLDDQAVRTGREAETDAEVELPLGAQGEVDHGEELVLLVVRPVEVSHRAERAIVLKPHGHLWGHFVTDLG